MKEIPLNHGYVALVDDADYDELYSDLAASQWSWRIVRQRSGKLYASRTAVVNGKRRTQYMHRLILSGAPRKSDIDHRDGDGLNNQRENFRVCDRSQNSWNQKKKRQQASSQYKGVSFHKRIGKFQAEIMVRWKKSHLGYFADEADAARVYDAAAMKHFGEYALLNFPKAKAA